MLELREIPADQLPARVAALVERTAEARAKARFLDLAESRTQVEQIWERTRDRAELWDVAEDGRTVGLLWLDPSAGEEYLINHVELAEPRLAAELVPLVVEKARAAGSHQLGLGVYPGDSAREAVGDQPGFLLRATNMVLPLDAAVGDPGPLELRPMTGVEYDEFMAANAEEYAGELAATGMTAEAAAERSTEQMAELLPEGADTEGMHFFTAWVDERAVGVLWLAAQDRMAFVYDIAVHEDQRRKGYGGAIMNAAAAWSRDHGHPVLGLNVFAHNPGARALYDALGYEVTQDYRALDLTDGD